MDTARNELVSFIMRIPENNIPTVREFLKKMMSEQKEKDTYIYDFGLEAKTPLGKRLLQIRREYIESGGELLNEEELEREIAERKGRRE